LDEPDALQASGAHPGQRTAVAVEVRLVVVARLESSLELSFPLRIGVPGEASVLELVTES